MNDTLKLPRTVDEPPMMLFWRGDELVPFFILFIIGFMMKQLFIAIVIGVLSIKVIRKYRDLHPNGYLVHYLWWKGIYPLSSRTTGNPFLRKYLNFHITKSTEE